MKQRMGKLIDRKGSTANERVQRLREQRTQHRAASRSMLSACVTEV
jgi:hypothetical protein